jgi:hypothetical protein
MWAFGSDVTGDAAVMTGGHDSFVGMLLDFLCRIWLAFLQTILPLPFICLLCGGTYFERKNLQLYFSLKHPA